MEENCEKPESVAMRRSESVKGEEEENRRKQAKKEAVKSGSIWKWKKMKKWKKVAWNNQINEVINGINP